MKACCGMQKNTLPKVTVVIVNWNGEQFLERCLATLMAQTVVPYETILVDNASSDGSLDIVRRFPSVRLLAQDKNLGFARANNLGIAATASEYVLLLNPDTVVPPGALGVSRAHQRNIEGWVERKRPGTAAAQAARDALAREESHVSTSSVADVGPRDEQ